MVWDALRTASHALVSVAFVAAARQAIIRHGGRQFPVTALIRRLSLQSPHSCLLPIRLAIIWMVNNGASHWFRGKLLVREKHDDKF